MGNGSYNHYHHHHNPHHNNFPHKNQNSTTTTTTNNFLPMLCRVSIKDTIVNQNHHHPHPRRICTKKDDPSSPKVTCIGKVKKSHHPTTTFSAAKPPTTTAAKYSKLRQIFSGKNYLLTTAAATATTASATSCRNSFSRRRPSNFVTIVPVVELNLSELDPPLPVIRRAAPSCGDGGADAVSLWKRRRSGGPGLRSLEIQPFQLQNNCGKSNNSSGQFFSPTTV